MISELGPIPFEKPEDYDKKLNLIPEQKPDEEIHQELSRVAEVLPGVIPGMRALNKVEEKRKFLKGEIANPTFIYKDILGPGEYEILKRAIDALKQQANGLENPAIRQLYQSRIENFYIRLNLIRAIGTDPKLFTESSIRYWTDVPESLVPILEKEALAKKGAIEQDEDEAVKPEQPAEEFLSTEMIVELFNNALEEYGFFPSWEAVISPKAGSITVNERYQQGEKKRAVVEIPPFRKDTAERIEKLIGHEMTHIFQGEAGRRSPLAIIGYQKAESGGLFCAGTTGQSEIQEGMGIFTEQYINWFRHNSSEFKFQPASVFSALAVWHARDNNFRGVFEKMKSYGLGDDEAWKRTSRVFRGVSDTSVPGNYCTYDANYRMGSQIVADFYQKNPDQIDRLWIGKIGLNSLGILGAMGIDKPALPLWFFRVLDSYSSKELEELKRFKS